MISEFPAPTLLSHSPLLRISKGDFFESHTIDRSSAGDVEMSRDDDIGAKPSMPVFGNAGAAPDHEARDTRQDGEFLLQGEVGDQDGRMWYFSKNLFETPLAVSTARRAPLAYISVGIGVKQNLIRAEHS